MREAGWKAGGGWVGIIAMLMSLHSNPHLSAYVSVSHLRLAAPLPAFTLKEGIYDNVWKHQHIFLKGNAAAKLFIFFFLIL